VDPEPVVASQKSDSLSVVSPHQQRRGGLTQPAQLPDMRQQAGPGSYPVQGGDLRYDPVCARVRRVFVLLSVPDVPRCAGPSAGVLASLQGQRTDDVAAAQPLRQSDGSCTALNCAEHLTINDAV